MIEYILFEQKKYRNIFLNIFPYADFNDILRVLNKIEFITTPISSEQIVFAILELINNSLRAHKEIDEMRKIRAAFSITDNTLKISIQDWGGGFDPENLPYNLNTSVDSIDTNDSSFQQYRENHGYMRFGIGLFVVKKTFTDFQLYFIDKAKKPVDWSPGIVKGTCIELSLKDDGNGV